MSNRNKYIFNTETLSYEIYRESTRDKVKSVAGVMLLGLALFLGYVFYYTKSLKTESLKTVLLEKRNRDLLSRIGLLDQKLDRQGDALSRLQMRDNNIYRPVFGMDEIPASVRNAGFGGIDRYASLAQYQNAGLLTSVAMKLDIIQKKTVIQSRSLDEVEFLSQRSGEM
ncbi:MAG: M23 family peptidase, partial [Bacteroidales bacterium]|nr:M23 family peptidase [Bacteroidales bacterium]